MAVCLLAGVLTFFWHRIIQRLRNPVEMLDGAGLALFAVSGTQKALAFGLHPATAAVLGMITGIGGGMTRDVLLNDVPTVLRAEIYAIAALAGAVVVVIGSELQLPSTAVMVTGALLCFALRIVALRRCWQLPRAQHDGQISITCHRVESHHLARLRRPGSRSTCGGVGRDRRYRTLSQ